MGGMEGFFVLRFSAQIYAPALPSLGCVLLSTMSGADIAMLAIHLVLDHDRASVLRRQLREIDNLMPAAGENAHFDRLCSGAHARRSIEYCEDVLAHLRCAYERRLDPPDRDLEAMCNVAVSICQNVVGRYGAEEELDHRRRTSAMAHVTSLFDLIVQPDNLRPWAREHLDLRGIRNWYRRLEERAPDPLCGTASADFLEIRDLLNARVGRGL